MTRAETVALVTLATAAYPSAQSKDPQPVVKAWSLLLSDLPFPVAKAAVVKLCRTSVYFPSVADIVQAASQLSPAKETLPCAAEAWEEVARLIQTAGPYKAPAYSCDAVRRAAQSIGWLQLCLGENPAADRAHFLKIYESLRQRQLDRRENETALALAGAGEAVKSLAARKSNGFIRCGSVGLAHAEICGAGP